MVAARKISRRIVRVEIVTTVPAESPERLRARDMIPGADPYIASLIRNLQEEVRSERLAKSALINPFDLESTPVPTEKNEQSHALESNLTGFAQPDYDRWSHLRPSYDRPWNER